MINRLKNRAFKRRQRELNLKKNKRQTQARLSGFDKLEDRRLLAAEILSDTVSQAFNPNVANSITGIVQTDYKHPAGADAIIVQAGFTDSESLTVSVAFDADFDGDYGDADDIAIAPTQMFSGMTNITSGALTVDPEGAISGQ